MSEIKLQINKLNKSFGIKQILNDLNFQVYSGEFLSILGPSGCGKTTFTDAYAKHMVIEENKQQV